MIKYNFWKINNIAGIHYQSNRPTKTLIIWGLGAPVTPDNGTLPDAPIILNYKVDIFVPDYIGFGRSEGRFTPKNCVKTFLKLHKSFKEGCTGYNHYLNNSTDFKYDRVIFIGKSFAAAYIPLLPKYSLSIKELAIFCPVVESSSCGSVAGEETNEDFLKAMKEDGYHHLYRGILDKRWETHLENKDGLSPINNIQYLKEAKIFIAHGQKDSCVHYSKSVKYYQKILSTFPEKRSEVVLKLYPNGDHGITTTNQATKDFLDWLKV